MSDAGEIVELLRRVERHLAVIATAVRHQAPADLAPADPVEQLRRICRERGFWIGPGDEVRTDAAAALLGVQPATLRTDRCYFARIPCRKVGGRALYRLHDLAAHLAGER